MKKPIYLDYAATTPVDPRVAERMAEFLTPEGTFGNPASRSHAYGWQAEAAVEQARQQVAELIGADPREVVWTSGATESDNLALKGAMEAGHERGRHLITSVTEHKAVIDTCTWLEQQGCEVTWLRPDSSGRIRAGQVEEALRPDTVVVSLMAVNNETGVANDIAAVGRLLREHPALFHVDAAQAVGKMPLNLGEIGADLVSLSAHKAYGPKGVGALIVRRDPAVRIAAQIHGGGHERGMRSGTLPTHQIVGMGEAFALVQARLAEDLQHLSRLRHRFLESVLKVEGVAVNGDPQYQVPNIVNLRFSGVDGESLMLGLHGLAVSSGSACASATMEPSYVLRAMGLSDAEAHASLRFSLGRCTTADEVDQAASQLCEALERLRAARRQRLGA